MQGKNFMQLLIILALLMYGGKSGAQNLLSEVAPVLESLGGEQFKEALKNAEEISTMLSAVQSLTGAPDFSATESEQPEAKANTEFPAIAFPLAPISNVADKQITYSLSKYISEN